MELEQDPKDGGKGKRDLGRQGCGCSLGKRRAGDRRSRQFGGMQKAGGGGDQSGLWKETQTPQ